MSVLIWEGCFKCGSEILKASIKELWILNEEYKWLFMHYFCIGQGVICSQPLGYMACKISCLAFVFSWVILCPCWKQNKKKSNMQYVGFVGIQ